MEYFEVIDGQQRLTTIYLILYYLNKLLAEKYQKRFLNYFMKQEKKSLIF